MRITNTYVTSRALQNLQQAMQNVSVPQEQITTGKRVNKPSDDPIDITKIVDLKATASRQTQYQKNIASGLEWMNATSSALESVLDALDEVDSLISTLDDPATSAERLNSVEEVDLLLMELLSAANRKLQDKYLFGGNETQTQPFTANYTGDEITSVTQNPDGIDSTRSARMSDTDTITLNVPGSSIFQPSGEGADDDVFQILTDLRTALENNDSEGMDAVQERLTTAYKSISAENAKVGGTIKRLENLDSQISDEALLTEDRRSLLEDADLAQAMMDYNQAELIYQAALSAAANVIQYSLVNFLS